MLPNGDIQLLESGIYDLEWYLNVEGISQVSQIAFDVVEVVNGVPNYTSPLIHCTFPLILVGQLVSQGMIPVSTPITIRFINGSTPTNIGNGNLSLTSNVYSSGELKIMGYTNS